MPSESLHASIQTALNTFDVQQFRASNMALLNALGYLSDRTQAIPGADPQAFREIAESHSGKTLNADKAKFAEWKQADLLFQFTDEELSEHKGLFQDAAINASQTRSYLFFAIELSGTRYSRTDLATISRQINRLFPMPVVVTFSYHGKLSVAVINRHPHKRDESRDVLGNVSLIREIDVNNPHRAHLDVLQELSLPKRLKWADDHNKPHNFDGLLAAWLAVLDTEELNRQFYKDLFAWFERAVTTARFPTDETKTLPPEEHVIRLITRLLFVWFIKEKGLIADDLFNETRIAGLLNDYAPDTGDSYYRAVLQNLFFATLNTEINKRGFSKETQTTHRDFSRYRYKAEMRDPNELLTLFRRTPFINGGLFDCLDTEAATRDGGWRIDCFTDNPRSRNGYSIPNRLFFSEDKNNPGLITLFNKYKFTVEENTPAEQEVALDPELLGKVFENLLAAYNPETRDTARKQTGSYYTPRAVVDYMVDESLTAYLSEPTHPTTATDPHGQKRIPRTTGHGPQATDDAPTNHWQQRIRYLLDYTDPFDDAEDLFTPTERDHIIQAIAEIKVLDPAVGSGAFPMGILHKLTLALRRLDPDNTHWETLQKGLAKQKAASAFDTKNQQDRDAELNEISATFERYRDSDFGRKLYLIQNSIYGVDIQPVASQIAKLRFFISLAIEQEPTGNAKDNYGIKPLPNLETRFVAANTLLALEKPAQLTLGQTKAVTKLEQELTANRERHFHATTRTTKRKCRIKDKELREKLAAALQKAGFLLTAADKIANWDPYDQNAGADWFDPEYMFGVTTGFNVVIGNPPYIQLQKNAGELGRLYKNAGFETFASTGDIYQLFYEKGCHLLTPQRGILVFITSNKWMRASYGEKLRGYLASQTDPKILLDFGSFQVFENATVDTNILLAQKALPCHQLQATHFADDFQKDDDIKDYAKSNSVSITTLTSAPWLISGVVANVMKEKIERVGTPLKDWDVAIYRGVTTGLNDAFVIDGATRQALIKEDPNSAEIIKPVLRGRDIKRYQARWADLWLITTFPSMRLAIDDYPAIKRHLLSFGKNRLEQSGKSLASGVKSRKKTQHVWFEAQDATAYHEEFAKKKLVWAELSRSGNAFSYDDRGSFQLNTTYMMTGGSLHYLLGVLNSKVMLFYLDLTNQKLDKNGWRWLGQYVERLPIPKIPAAKQRPFIRLVERILQIKASNPSADTTKPEEEIDQLVYELYGLTEEEIAAVEKRK